MSNQLPSVEVITTEVDKAVVEQKPRLTEALPETIPFERFRRSVEIALPNVYGIQEVSKADVIEVINHAANDGLLPDGREGALVTYGKKGGGRTIQWMPMIGGIIKKARQSGEVKNLYAEVVFENDEFDYQLGDNPSITHSPAKLGTPRGKPIGCYAICHLMNGGIEREVMDSAQIASVENASKAKSGPWKGAFKFEMWRKTVLRRLSKRLPLSNDLMSLMQGPETEADFSEAHDEVQPLNEDMLQAQSEFDGVEEADFQEVDEEATPEDQPELITEELRGIMKAAKRADGLTQMKDVRADLMALKPKLSKADFKTAIEFIEKLENELKEFGME